MLREGTFTYTVPGFVAGSTHTVRLHFAELYFSTTGQREFNVAINGAPVLTNFDIVAAAGGRYKANVQQFTTTANSSGQIVISLSNGAVNQPEMTGIEIQ
ncbi:malectin domain-containing carbohydrate-binding protein [Tunturiibacter empetritectus]|uniref:malectin domain-containing carbohydrate-binding protein n=1 Tax=Tunturiibacter empetritectus TaxID=3069691 RepID=UPI003D9B30B5